MLLICSRGNPHKKKPIEEGGQSGTDWCGRVASLCIQAQTDLTTPRYQPSLVREPTYHELNQTRLRNPAKPKNTVTSLSRLSGRFHFCLLGSQRGLMLLRMPWLCARDQQQSDAWRLHHGTRQPPFAWSVFDHVPGLIIQVSWRSTE
jgi:hypothetical protein